MLKKLGQKIRKVRVAKGLTVANMGEELGMSTSAYAKIERGETNTPATRLIQIAEVLDISVSDMFNERDFSVAENKNMYGFASKEEVEQLANIVNTLVKEIGKLRLDINKHNTKKNRKK